MGRSFDVDQRPSLRSCSARLGGDPLLGDVGDCVGCRGRCRSAPTDFHPFRAAGLEFHSKRASPSGLASCTWTKERFCCLVGCDEHRTCKVVLTQHPKAGVQRRWDFVGGVHSLRVCPETFRDFAGRVRNFRPVTRPYGARDRVRRDPSRCVPSYRHPRWSVLRLSNHSHNVRVGPHDWLFRHSWTRPLPHESHPSRTDGPARSHVCVRQPGVFEDAGADAEGGAAVRVRRGVLPGQRASGRA